MSANISQFRKKKMFYYSKKTQSVIKNKKKPQNKECFEGF